MSQLFRFLVFVALLAALCQAQIGGGSIVGVARDPSGAAVPGVRITATNQNTNETRTVSSNAEGYYEFPLLPAGPYRIRAEATGFDTVTGEPFDLASGTRPRIDLTLRVGAVSERVDVEATAPQINTTTTDLGVVMPRSRIEELPLNGRNFQDLVELQAGVVNSPSSGAGGRGGISFHGSSALGTNVMLDGVDMSFGEVNGTASFTSAGGPSTLVNAVSIEAVEQFKSTTNAYSAEYGRAGGGVLNVTTRSGTNKFHSTLFEYFRHDKLNANDFFSNKNALGKTPLRWNQFGANLGGPLRKDKLFFFFNYEGSRVKRQAQITGNVPTPALLARVSEAQRKVLSLLPTTFTPSNNPDVGTHIRDDRANNRDDTFLTKVDWVLGRQRLAVRHSYNNQDYNSPNLSPVMPTVYPLRSHNAVIEHNLTVGAAAFNELRVGFNRADLFRSPKDYDLVPASIAVSGISTSLSNYIHFVPTTYTLADNFTIVRGRHSFKTGFEIRNVRSVRDQGGPPAYTYNNVTDLINERPNTVGLSFGGSKGQRTTNMGYFFQDDWRVSNKLQMNLGVRYEYSPPFRGGFNIATSDPFGPFIKTNREPMFAPDRNDFAPRLGIVYTPTQRTVIRTGAGISYIMPQAIHYYDMAFINPALPGVASLSSGDVPAANLRFPDIYPFQNAVLANPALLPASFRLSRSVADFNRRDTYVAMWNLAVQRQITSTFSLQAAYVGTKTNKLISVRPLNLIDPVTGRRPDQSLGQINVAENAARISYHGLELSANQRLWKGLSYDAYFTWSKTQGYYTPDNTITFTGGGLQDPLNIASSNGPMEGAPNKVFRAVVSYALPGGKSFQNGFARAVLGGWTLRAITGRRSGIPVNVTSGVDFIGNGRSAGQRPDYVYGIEPYVRDHDTQVWLAPAAFSSVAARAEHRFGNVGYNALLGPAAFTMDTGLHKTFTVREGQRITLRIESFNTLNHTVLGNPTASTNNVNFGKILSARSPRAYQIALRYSF